MNAAETVALALALTSACAFVGILFAAGGVSRKLPPADDRFDVLPTDDAPPLRVTQPVRWTNQEWQRLHDAMARDKAEAAQLQNQRGGA